jgi:hypothetical protein
VRYAKENAELIAIGFHDITIWSLQGTMKRGGIRVEATLKHHYQTGLPHNEWIKCVHINSQNLIYAGIDRKVHVVNMAGELVEKFSSSSLRHITCIYNCETVGYSIIGCSDGTIEIVNVWMRGLIRG